MDRPSHLGLQAAMSELPMQASPAAEQFEGKDFDETEEFVNHTFDENHFITTAVRSYMRSSIFWCIAVCICAMRAASPPSVFLAYLSLILRVVQLGALYT